MNSISLGASGWGRREWGEVVYGGERRGRGRLDVLTGCISCAEIEETLHAPLRPETARLYARRVAGRPGFLSTALAGRVFTEERRLDELDAAQWRGGLLPLVTSERLGALVFAFPEQYQFTRENRGYLIALRRAFHGFPVAAELKHESWLGDEAWTSLAEHRIGYVNTEETAARGVHLTTALATFRQGGGGQRLLTREELAVWKPRIERMAARAGRSLVIFANGVGAGSLVNAIQMAEMPGVSALEAPAPLIERYPVELASDRARRPVQPFPGPGQAV